MFAGKEAIIALLWVPTGRNVRRGNFFKYQRKLPLSIRLIELVNMVRFVVGVSAFVVVFP